MVLIPWLYPPFPVSCPFRFAIALLRSLPPQESRKWLCLLSQEIADYLQRVRISPHWRLMISEREYNG